MEEKEFVDWNAYELVLNYMETVNESSKIIQQSKIGFLTEKDALNLWGSFSKTELIKMILELNVDITEKDKTKIRERLYLISEINKENEIKLNKEDEIQYNSKSKTKAEFQGVTNKITCDLCNKEKEESSFDENIQMCKECFSSLDELDVANYLLDLLEDKEKEGDLSSFFQEIIVKEVEDLSTDFSLKQLKDLVYKLSNLDGLELNASGEYIIDYHRILEEYSGKNIGGRINRNEEKNNEEDIWRKFVPPYLKRKYKNWNTASIEDVYNETKRLIVELGSEARSNLMGFSTELSQIIFADKQESEEEHFGNSDISEEVEEYITYMVEMIILPHLEVLDRIRAVNGNIQFVNVNDHHFSEGLKKETKDRDRWRCVICNSDISLHVHHRIPREYGGINHLDNLVTVCASCHSAVETADVKKALSKGISNYRKNLGRKLQPERLTHDKEVLKEEIEKTLDKILATSMTSGDDELSKNIVNVMDMVKIVFYE